jgi:hypothetical protein
VHGPELHGTPCIGLEDVTPGRESIMASRSFGRMVTMLDEMTEAVATPQYPTRRMLGSGQQY